MTPRRYTGLSLWDIERGLAELMEARDEAEDEAARVAVDQALTEYTQREVVKADGIRGYLMHGRLMAKAAREEAEQQLERARVWEKRIERLGAFCIAALQAVGKTRVEGKTGKLVVKSNGGKRPLVITDGGLIPSDFYPQVISHPLDKDKLRASLEAGETVPGAHLADRGVHLEVK